nr:MAG TPA: chromosome partition protein [Caudoviricetes sp.]
MSTITLKSLSLVNFKGVRDLNLDFTQQVTVISGENGTGKTTIFDSFTWLLFGKDSLGRSDSNFSIKTIDPQTGKPILKLEHSVTGVLDVDGKEVKLQRKYVENWVKPKGTTEEHLENHKTEFYINDVKLGTKKEYDSEIASIIPEDVFKMITNPFAFTSLKPEVQKNMLLEMAGTITNEEVAVLSDDYVALLEELNGKPLVSFLKEISAKKKACKDVLAVIPSQIDTANNLRPTPENWEEIEKELEDKKKLLANVDAKISDKSKASEEEYKRKASIQREIGAARLDLNKRENAIRSEAQRGNNQAKMELNQLSFDLQSAQKELQRINSSISRTEAEITQANSDLEVLRNEWKAINAETISYPDGAFVCPTCKRELEADDIAAKKAEMEANFNANKAKRTRANIDAGKGKKQRIELLNSELSKLKDKKAELEDNINALSKTVEEKKASIPEVPDTTHAIASDSECVSLRNKISDLENQLTVEVKPVDVSDLQEQKKMFNENIQELYKLLAKRDQITRADKEIKDLQEKQIANNQVLADLEKWEYTAQSFQKAKDNKLQDRINGLFQLCSFSFISEQLNGGEKITCVCTVNGTPFPDVNFADRVNAGLDIINAICRTKGVSAPIFIDNRESVNRIIPTISQVINLCVSNDPQITIK